MGGLAAPGDAPRALPSRGLSADAAGRAPAPFRVRVQNTGQTRWLAETDESGVGQVRLGLSLLDAEGRLRQLDFGRCSLARDVAPGQEIRIEGQIPPLASPGRYVLRFDLVAEGVSWFAERGTIPYTASIEVTS